MGGLCRICPHSHIHDEHHQHSHDALWDGKQSHSHEHHHKTFTSPLSGHSPYNLHEIADPDNDDEGKVLENSRLPKTAHKRKKGLDNDF